MLQSCFKFWYILQDMKECDVVHVYSLGIMRRKIFISYIFLVPAPPNRLNDIDSILCWNIKMYKLLEKTKEEEYENKELSGVCAQTLPPRNNDFDLAQLLAFPADRFELG